MAQEVPEVGHSADLPSDSLEREAGRRGADPEPANAVSLARTRKGADTSRDRLLRSDPLPLPTVARDPFTRSDQLRPKSARDPLPRSRTTSLERDTITELVGNRVSPRERSLKFSRRCEILEKVRVALNSDFGRCFSSASW